jgi:hypothetical protein
VDAVQLVNGLAATIAAVIWWHAMGDTLRISGTVPAAITGVIAAVCSWYAGINLLLGLGLLDLDNIRATPYFRFAFPLLVLGPAIRYAAYRPLRRELLAAHRGATESENP